MKNFLLKLINWYLYNGSLESDSEDDKLQKALLVIISSSLAFLAIFWGLLYIYLNLMAGYIPLSYSVFSFISLIHYFITKRFVFFRNSQLLLILILPFMLQAGLGGIHNGSVVMLWAFLSPLGALMFAGAKKSISWVLSFISLLIISIILDPFLHANRPDISRNLIYTFHFMNIAAVLIIIYFTIRFFASERDKAHQSLENEHQRSESLLLNILPKPIARQLKDNPTTIADSFNDVTVLFADIVDFTKLSERLSPQELVRLLDEVFSAFDHIAETYSIEKIKTIGDAYMAVSGLPTPSSEHAHNMAKMAIDMLKYINSFQHNGTQLKMRIGLSSGEVVAGVIGRKKFIYDLWGDTVNTASRMESHGMSGTIHVTDATYFILKNDYRFEKRENIYVKGKGEMSTYLLVH